MHFYSTLARVPKGMEGGIGAGKKREKRRREGDVEGSTTALTIIRHTLLRSNLKLLIFLQGLWLPHIAKHTTYLNRHLSKYSVVVVPITPTTLPFHQKLQFSYLLSLPKIANIWLEIIPLIQKFFCRFTNKVLLCQFPTLSPSASPSFSYSFAVFILA